MFRSLIFTASLSIFTITAFATLTTQSKTEPVNLYYDKQALINYHDSGQYMTDIAKVTQAATKVLKATIEHNKSLKTPQKLAVVFDVDETTLSNYKTMKAMDFGGKLINITKAEDLGLDSSIKPTLKLFNFAKSHHVAIFLITGRKPFERAITVKNLHRAGYSGWKHLYLKPLTYHGKSATPYKAKIRESITQLGYTIVFTIGDQYSDLKGGYALKTFKLPNPFYYIP